MPILACKRVGYFSQGDEVAFFGWIARVSCVTDVWGSGETLYLCVPRSRISDTNLRELLALFYRYRVPMRQLAQFESPRNRGWFFRSGAYWFTRVWTRADLAKKSPLAGHQRQAVTTRVRRAE